VKIKIFTIGINNKRGHHFCRPIISAQLMKFLPGINPLIAGTSALGNKK
jgi:hypothetical protein